MPPVKTAKVNLTADQASGNEQGYLIFNGSPSDATSGAITRIENGDMIDERAKSKTAATKILRQHEFRSPNVKLESWRFPDQVTNDHHHGKVWVMQLPQQGGKRKKRKPTKKSKTKSVKRSKVATASRKARRR